MIINLLDEDERGGERATAAAVAALMAGYCVVAPTDTVYGLTCAAFAPGKGPLRPWRQPVEEMASLKGRSVLQPFILLAATWRDAERLTGGGWEAARAWGERVPWPVTFLVKAVENWGPPFTNEGGAVAFRVPRTGFILRLLRHIPFLFSTSANYAGETTPSAVATIPAGITAKTVFVLDAGRSPAATPSAIIDFTSWPPVKIRGGAECDQAIEAFVDENRRLR